MPAITSYNTSCKTRDSYESDGYTIIELSGGTVGLYEPPILLGGTLIQNPSISHKTKPCCELLGYTFDVITQECRWGIDESELFKVILNPEGNSSVLFNVEDNEKCELEVSFDYLFVFECEKLRLAKSTAIGSFGFTGSTTFDELESSANTLSVECDFYQNVVDEANSVPHVIQYLGTGVLGADGTTIPSDPSLYYGGNLPPLSYGIFDPNVLSYCLTDLGKEVWESTVVTDGIWSASYGTNTTTYTNEQVKSFIESEPNPGDYHTATCDYSIYDRERAEDTIATYTPLLEACKEELQNILTDIRNSGSGGGNVSGLVGVCNTYIDMFEQFETAFTIEVESTGATKIFTSVYEETIMNIGSDNLYNYINSTSGKTGILISGDTGLVPTLAESELLSSNPDLCTQIRDNLVTDLFNQYLETNELPSTQEEQIKIFTELTGWYQSCWLNYKTTITDKLILDVIENRNINISISIKNTCTDFTILLDRIKMNKVCTKVDNVKKFISEPPKFELTKIVDNKKSWLSNQVRDERFFDLKYRGTEYNTNHHRLVVNTKEVDLNLSPSRAVEQDVWCYISDNSCILEGCVSSGETYSSFSCPSGYTLDVDGDSCTELTVTAATSSATTYTVGPGVGLTNSIHYLSRGTIFVEDVTDNQWPIYWTGTTKDSWVGPYYNVDYLTDYSGNYLKHSGFGINKFSDGTLQYSSPDAFSGIRSKFGKNNSDIISSMFNPNILWGGTSGSVSASTFNDLTSTNSAGRLLNASVWSNPGTLPVQEWIGLSYCLELTETKTYRLGFAADDETKVKINGKYLIDPTISPTHDAGIHDNFSISYSRSIQSYVVMGIRLSAGKNIIEIEGYNNISGIAGFVCEIYDASEAQLKNIRFESELNSVRIFSTIDRVGTTFDLGETSAYSCPVGYSLDTCASGSTVCTKIDRITREDEQLDEYCPCDGFPLIVKDYENATLELPLSGSIVTVTYDSDCVGDDTPTVTTTTSDFECDDISSLVSNYGTTTTLRPINVIGGGTAYAIGTGTTTSFDGFWITEENDETIGVYISKWVSGTTNTQENVSSQVTEECCKVIDDAFEIYADMFNQGINTYPNATWDKNTNKCVYSKCGDNKCIDLDSILTTEVNQIDTVNEFASVLSSELIDVKNRQTISSYATLRMLYDRYNTRSLEFCGIDSSKYDYSDMDTFGNTVGDYWIDLIEQVVPATTIWGSTYAYKNTVFDQQKFNYKRGNLYLCEAPTSGETTLPTTISSTTPEGIVRARSLTQNMPDAISTCSVYTANVNCNPADPIMRWDYSTYPATESPFYYAFIFRGDNTTLVNSGAYGTGPEHVVIDNDNIYLGDGTLTSNGGQRELKYYDGTIVTMSQSSSTDYTLSNFATDIENEFLSRNGVGLTVTPLVIGIKSISGNIHLKIYFEIEYLVHESTVRDATLVNQIDTITINSSNVYQGPFDFEFDNGTDSRTELDGTTPLIWEPINATITTTTTTTTPTVIIPPPERLPLASDSTVSVISQVLPSPIPTTGTTAELITLQPSITRCNGVWIKDTGCESDFLGEVTTFDINGAIIPS